MKDATMQECFTAEQLIAWRKGYGWTQEYAAGRLGLTVHGYTKKEQGQRHVSRQDMKLIRYVDQDEAKQREKKKATA
jgi:transcriptional regulator with XRE-family HTH domain